MSNEGQCVICGGISQYLIRRKDRKIYCQFCDATIDHLNYRPLNTQELEWIKNRMSKKQTLERFLTHANGHDLYLLWIPPGKQDDFSLEEENFWNYSGTINLWKKDNEIKYYLQCTAPAPG